MNYFISAMIGLIIGIFNILLMFIIQKKENLIVFNRDNFYRQKSFWFAWVGMILIAVYFRWIFEEFTYNCVMCIILCGYLMIMSVTDYKFKQLPDIFHIIYLLIFIIYKLLFGDFYDLMGGVISLIVTFLILGLIYLTKKEQFGLGDVKLLSVCAFLLGFPNIAYFFFRGLLVAGVFSVIRIFVHKADLKTEIPMVPFLLIGALI